MCVGGSTVVNNAVCFDLPDRVRDRWLDPSSRWGSTRTGCDQAFERRARLPAGRTRSSRASPQQPGRDGRWSMRLQDRAEWPFELVECNIADCLGSGYCNIGCAYGKKLSALDWTLPKAQEEFPDAVRILPDCRVDKLLMRDNRALGVRAQLAGRPQADRAGEQGRAQRRDDRLQPDPPAQRAGRRAEQAAASRSTWRRPSPSTSSESRCTRSAGSRSRT